MALTQIVTGNGFTTNAQRYDDLSHSEYLSSAGETLYSVSAYTMSLKYRSSGFFSSNVNSGSILSPNLSVTTKIYNPAVFVGSTSLHFYPSTTYFTISTSSNSIPTSNPSTRVFIVDLPSFPNDYIINTGMTAIIFNASNQIHCEITGWNSSTGSLTGVSYYYRGSGTFSSWDINIDTFYSHTNNSITIPTSGTLYQSAITFTIGKNLYYSPNMTVILDRQPFSADVIRGYVTSYNSSSGSISINTTYASGSGSYTGMTINAWYLYLYSNSTITIPSISGITITGYTCTGLTTGITNYLINSGNNNSQINFSWTYSGNFKLTNYNSSTGYFTAISTTIVSPGTGSTWALITNYTGHYIELDEINVLA